MASRKYKFCASCFNYCDSCDCLGNLEDHEHINTFERPGKGNDDDEEIDDEEEDDNRNKGGGEVWYFRAQVDLTLMAGGNMLLGALMTMEEMWTDIPPDNPSLYLSIPKSRFPMDPVNIGGSFPNKPEYIKPKYPWEIPYFQLSYPRPPEKSDAAIASQAKDCTKDCLKRFSFRPVRLGICTAKCAVIAAGKKAFNEFNVSLEDIYLGVQKTINLDNLPLYIGLIPLIKKYTPPRLWNAADDSVVPGCGFQWVEMHLIDGSDPSSDFDCSGKLSSNVDGVDQFWSDNQNGGDTSETLKDYYPDASDPTTDVRMMMMPHVPPPVPPVGPPRCTQWALDHGFCDKDDDPPPYIPPPPTHVDPPIIVDPPIVLPPTGTPPTVLPTYDITNNINFPMAVIQYNSKTRADWYNSGSTGYADDRQRPHLNWGAAAIPLKTGDVIDRGVTLEIPENNYEYVDCFFYYMAHRPIAGRVSMRLTYVSGPKPSGMGFKVHWDNSVKPGDTQTLRGDVTTFQFNKNMPAGISIHSFRLTPLHVNPPGLQNKQEFKLEFFTAWDKDCKPVFTLARDIPWETPYGGPPPVFNGIGVVDFIGNNNKDCIAAHPIPLNPMVGGVRVKPPTFSWGNGECIICHNQDPKLPGVAVHKMNNTGDGGITPINSQSYFFTWVNPSANGYGQGIARIDGSLGSYYGACKSWTK
ncbi:hypothetical protein [Lake Sarah-associated circular virus-28]|uniref:hypothetical protein n=1 Tax=Lake Sarah-associated circular virus-28 TaxID=1685755 RepID=UPI000777CA20|nr:hypothetical protein [Lake Sarah-associated circular virus-28]ALE29694.1 hypothetical protein [Lake Sarah-associated circular virus-28]